MTTNATNAKGFYLVRPERVSMVDGGTALVVHLGQHQFHSTALHVELIF